MRYRGTAATKGATREATEGKGGLVSRPGESGALVRGRAATTGPSGGAEVVQ